MKILSPRQSRLSNDRGAAAVEFALILVPLVLLVFGIFEFGRVWSEVEILESAAREGARVAAVRGTSDEVEDAVNAAAFGLAPISPAISVDPGPGGECTPDTVGDLVTVGWTQTWDIQIPLVPVIPPQSRDIKGVFRCE
jgi:Flp pilus assembly protein TadG